MIKRFISIAAFLCLACTFVFGATRHSSAQPPERLDSSSQSAHIKLGRAQYILSTLISNPNQYQLILSSQPSFGAMAVPAHVYADKPTIIVYQGALSPDRSNEELAFVLAHELSHLQLYHNESLDMQMNRLLNGPPVGISGMTVSIFHQKLEERAADMHGLYLYKKAGYDPNFFSYTLKLIQINPNIHFGTTHVFQTSRSSLSAKDAHFSIQERFELLSQQV